MTARDDLYAAWTRLPLWLTREVLTPNQRAGLSPVKVWRLALRSSGLPFVARSVGLWISEFLSGAYQLQDVHELADKDPLKYRQHFTMWRSATTIAAACGAHPDTVRDAINVLDDAGWLHVERTDPATGREWRALNEANRLTIAIPAQAPQAPAPDDPCPHCEFVAASPQGLGAHVRAKHPDPPDTSRGVPTPREARGQDLDGALDEPPTPHEPGAPTPREASTHPTRGEGPTRHEPNELTSGTRFKNSLQENSPLDPGARGRSLAEHVTANRLTREDAERAGDLYQTPDDRDEFLEGLRQGLAS